MVQETTHLSGNVDAKNDFLNFPAFVGLSGSWKENCVWKEKRCQEDTLGEKNTR